MTLFTLLTKKKKNLSIKPARFGNFHTECCYKIKKPTSKFNRKRKQVIQSSYIRIKYYNLLYKSISHPLTKNKAKNLYKYYHTFSQNRKIRERKQTKKTNLPISEKNQKAIVHKNNTDYSKCTHGYEKCQINSALSWKIKKATDYNVYQKIVQYFGIRFSWKHEVNSSKLAKYNFVPLGPFYYCNQ